MARERLLECSFLVPVRRDRDLSDGKRHLERVWTWLEQGLFERFKGGTRATGLYEGWYEDPNSHDLVSDQSRKYFVALHRAQVDHLRSLLAEACQVFKQKCIYLSVAGAVEFVEARDEV